MPNKFRILKGRHIQIRKPYQLPGRTKNSSYYCIVPRSGLKLTTYRLHSFIMADVSHALNHSAMEANFGRSQGMLSAASNKNKLPFI